MNTGFWEIFSCQGQDVEGFWTCWINYRLRLEFWETGKTVFGMVSVRNWTVLAPVNAISCASASMF
ncbi:Uncharacterised protein [Streptococcus pneumoniae]|nr:Uncharacterised protein [Streptococcus pneumoniae]